MDRELPSNMGMGAEGVRRSSSVTSSFDNKKKNNSGYSSRSSSVTSSVDNKKTNSSSGRSSNNSRSKRSNNGNDVLLNNFNESTAQPYIVQPVASRVRSELSSNSIFSASTSGSSSSSSSLSNDQHDDRLSTKTEHQKSTTQQKRSIVSTTTQSPPLYSSNSWFKDLKKTDKNNSSRNSSSSSGGKQQQQQPPWKRHATDDNSTVTTATDSKNQNDGSVITNTTTTTDQEDREGSRSIGRKASDKKVDIDEVSRKSNSELPRPDSVRARIASLEDSKKSLSTLPKSDSVRARIASLEAAKKQHQPPLPSPKHTTRKTITTTGNTIKGTIRTTSPKASPQPKIYVRVREGVSSSPIATSKTTSPQTQPSWRRKEQSTSPTVENSQSPVITKTIMTGSFPRTIGSQETQITASSPTTPKTRSWTSLHHTKNPTREEEEKRDENVIEKRSYENVDSCGNHDDEVKRQPTDVTDPSPSDEFEDDDETNPIPSDEDEDNDEEQNFFVDVDVCVDNMVTLEESTQRTYNIKQQQELSVLNLESCYVNKSTPAVTFPIFAQAFGTHDIGRPPARIIDNDDEEISSSSIGRAESIDESREGEGTGRRNASNKDEDLQQSWGLDPLDPAVRMARETSNPPLAMAWFMKRRTAREQQRQQRNKQLALGMKRGTNQPSTPTTTPVDVDAVHCPVDVDALEPSVEVKALPANSGNSQDLVEWVIKKPVQKPTPEEPWRIDPMTLQSKIEKETTQTGDSCGSSVYSSVSDRTPITSNQHIMKKKKRGLRGVLPTAHEEEVPSIPDFPVVVRGDHGESDGTSSMGVGSAATGARNSMASPPSNEGEQGKSSFFDCKTRQGKLVVTLLIVFMLAICTMAGTAIALGVQHLVQKRRDDGNDSNSDGQPEVDPSWFYRSQKPSMSPVPSPTPNMHDDNLRSRSPTKSDGMIEVSPRSYPTMNPTVAPSPRPAERQTAQPTITPTVTETLPFEEIGFQQVDTVIGSLNEDSFGWAVSMSSNGEVMAVGAPNTDVVSPDGTSLNRGGRVHVYQRKETNWKWEERDFDLGGRNNEDNFGIGVALSADGSIMAVSEPQHDEGGDQAGNVRVFKYNTALETYELMGEEIPGMAPNSYFGVSLALSADGTRLLVGAPFYSDLPLSILRGQVRVYEFNAQELEWKQRGTPLLGTAAQDQFGYSVDMSADGNIIVASAPGNIADDGYVRVWQWDSDTNDWIRMGGGNDETKNDDMLNEFEPPSIGDRFGHDVSLSVTAEGRYRLAVGIPMKDYQDDDESGMVVVYEYKTNSNSWNQLGELSLTWDQHQAGDKFGYSINFLEGNLLAVGAPGMNENSGSVQLYRYNEWLGDWELHPDPPVYESTTPGDAQITGHFFGASVAVRRVGPGDLRLAVGATQESNDGGGFVALFEQL